MPTIKWKVNEIDAFLKGFNVKSEEVKNREENRVKNVNITEELKDLWKVYADAEEHLLKKEKSSLETLNYYMEIYLNVLKERQKISEKLKNLKCKLEVNKSSDEKESCIYCNNEDEGEEE